ncbi:MAG TPA: hypothetical protein VN962_14965 [Polyangia bacterium]|nr:hypothetical protein [Polyangia bacterium]
MPKQVVVAQYSAEGGPEKPFMAPDGHEAGPTDAGAYIIAYCTRHRSRRYPQWSSIPWGSPLKMDGERLLVYLDTRWQDVFKLTGATPDAVESFYAALYGVEKVPRVVVHSYGEVLIPFPKGAASGPYELHFDPGLHNLVIVGTSK